MLSNHSGRSRGQDEPDIQFPPETGLESAELVQGPRLLAGGHSAPKVLILELNSFHTELLPMYQMLIPALFDDQEIDLRYYVLPGLVEQARDMVGMKVHPLNSSRLRYAMPTKGLRGVYYRWRIKQLIDRIDPVAIVFNTLEPMAYLDTFRWIRHPLKIGIAHNPRQHKIEYQMRGPGQLIFCLHEYNYQWLKKDRLVDGYLSPFFKYRDVPAVPAVKERLEIAVPGIISSGRRKYLMLLDLCEQLSRQAPRLKVVFNILGDAGIQDGPKFSRIIKQRGLDGHFMLHSWLSYSEFFQQLQRAHYVMPLVDHLRGLYTSDGKVTLAFGHSGAYGKPMILHRDIASAWGVPEEACVIYTSTENLVKRLSDLSPDSFRPKRYRRWITGKIEENRSFLRKLSHTHKVFASVR